ncbi:hypothetical protein [Ruegeria arenilitoris]|uniref:hypothetical protein n=1 Tax=Ruegeria arenilitoris TaxID=1173585 RepID=UPI00147A0DD5|nr:hypothetical protein [Ruegeria arenilitoris]
MTKASGQKTRPEVAKKSADQASDIYDFVQSSEWQKVLEKARIEREKNLSARKQKSKETQKPKPKQSSADQSTTGVRPSGTHTSWSHQLEEAREKRNEVLARRGSESEKPRPGVPDEGQGNESGDRLNDKVEKIFGTHKPKTSSAEASQSSQDSLRRKLNHARSGKVQEDNGSSPNETLTDGDASKNVGGDHSNSGLSLKLSTEEIDHRLSKKLLRSLRKEKQARGKVSLGLLALGCVIGVIASSSVFLFLSRSGNNETVSLTTAEAEIAIAAPLQGENAGQSGAVQPVVSSGGEEELVISADVSDLPPRPTSPDSSLVQVENLNSFASLTPSLSEFTNGPEVVEPIALSAVPSVLAYVPALEQPLLPVGGAGYLPRQEANPSFLPYESVPEYYGTAIVLSGAVSARFDPIEIAVEAFASPLRASLVEMQPVLFTTPTPLPPVDGPGTLPKQIWAIQPDWPVLIDPVDHVLTSVALNPSEQIEGPELSPEAMQLLIAAPRKQPLDATVHVALPIEEIEPPATISQSRGATFRLYAPNRLSDDDVDTVVADLTTTGHELSGTARVGFRVSQSNVRFYHRQDAAKAAALAEDAGALLRDFTGSKSKTPSGVVELWLAGKGYGNSPTKRTTKRSSRNGTANNPLNQLRSQVLQKLRASTN